MPDDIPAAPTPTDEPHATEHADLRDALQRVGLTLKRPTKPELLHVVDEILTIADQRPAIRPLVLEYVLSRATELRNSTESSKSPDAVRTTYAQFVDAFMDTAIRQNPPAPTFYRKLASVVDSPVIDSREGRVFALYWLIIDSRLPYFPLPEIEIPEAAEWRAGIVDPTPLVARAIHVMARGLVPHAAAAHLAAVLADSETDLERAQIIGVIITDAEIRGTARERSRRERGAAE